MKNNKNLRGIKGEISSSLTISIYICTLKVVYFKHVKLMVCQLQPDGVEMEIAVKCYNP